MTLPGGVKLSTGVMVLYADERSFTLMTPQGHMFAGWITFSAEHSGDQTLAQAQVLMRASDPVYEIGLALGGHRQEDIFWDRTLTKLAAYFEHRGDRRDDRRLCRSPAPVAALAQRLAERCDPHDDVHRGGACAQAARPPRLIEGRARQPRHPADERRPSTIVACRPSSNGA